jgi:hypothetical protein
MNSLSEPHQVQQKLSAYVGRQITLAITDLREPANKPEISLFVGVLQEIANDYTIVASNGNAFRIPKEWLTKVKLMEEGVKRMLGGSDLLLPTTRPEVEAIGFTYHRDPSGNIDFRVK